MKLTYGSNRLDFCREVFYWLLFALMWGKLSDVVFGTLVGAIVASYLGNRAYTDSKTRNVVI